VPDPCIYDYAIVRVVPRVERGEFVNVGVILSCASQGYLQARIELDDAIQAGLATIPAVCAGGEQAGAIGHLSTRERFHWLVAPRSTSIQMSAVHTGRCSDLDAALEHLMDTMVRSNQRGFRSIGKSGGDEPA
jgi:Protein of unknown function (DUF3037)